ncbi:MAG: tRNA (guanosine(37)-N1)-methyltransferase TrmD, partial [Bacilli bacterium]
MLKIKILTLFPEFFDSFIDNSIIKRAIAKGAVKFEIINIRDYSKDKNRRIDDRPAGGGAGLIMRMQP